MAEVTVKSQSITDQDASPRVAVQAGAGAGAPLTFVEGYAAVAATDEDLSTYRLVRVPSNAKMKRLTVEATALGGSCAANYGLHYASAQADCGPGIVAGAVIDADFFASAVVHTNAVAPTNIINEGGFLTIAERGAGMPLWQAAGLSADPGGKFDIVATLTVDAATGGSIYVAAEYVAG